MDKKDLMIFSLIFNQLLEMRSVDFERVAPHIDFKKELPGLLVTAMMKHPDMVTSDGSREVLVELLLEYYEKVKGGLAHDNDPAQPNGEFSDGEGI